MVVDFELGGRFGYHSGGEKCGEVVLAGLGVGPERQAIEVRRLVGKENCHYWSEGFWAGEWVDGLVFAVKEEYK